LLSITGRVLSVRPRHDGTFGVTLGPGPDVYWYIAQVDPPKLGVEVAVDAELGGRREVAWNGKLGTMTVLLAPHVRAVERGARVIAPQWIERIRASMARPLYGYQIDGGAWMAAQLTAGRGAMLCDDQGLGKTTQAIAALATLNLYPALVVCPMNLKVNWARELGWAARPPSIQILATRGRKEPLRGADVTILNYSLLRYRETELAEAGFRCVVFDEAHEIKEPKPRPTHQAAVATRLAAWIGLAVCMTGSPMLNRPAELWRLLHITDPGSWPDFEEYAERYCRAPEEGEIVPARRIVTSHGRAERLDELQARVSTTMLRRLKVDVLRDLPPKSRRSVLVQLDAWDMDQYRLAERDVVAWLRAQGQGTLATRATKALALVKLSKLRRLAALGKLREAIPDYLRAWFDRTDPDPLVVFAYHRDVIAGILHICTSLGLRVSSISGSDPGPKRQQAVDDFMEARTDIFVAPIRSAGVGLNLQRASDSLFCERLWVDEMLVQAEDRLHRIGQDRPVTVTYMDAGGTIDEYMAHVNAAKQTLVRRVVDDASVEAAALAAVDAVVQRYVA